MSALERTTDALLQLDITRYNDYRDPVGESRERLEAEAFVQIQRLANLQRETLEPLFAAHGVSGQQYNVLRILRGAGVAGLALNEIGRRLIERDPDVTRLVDRMEARGWVRRERSTEDRRIVVARLTPKGLHLVNLLDEPVARHHAAAFGPLGGKRLAELIRTARELLASP